MFKNYFKIALRNLKRNKAYAFINVMGLALGVAAGMVIFLIVRNELTYDHFHRQADRIYRVTLNELDYNPSVSFAVAPALRNDFPELEHVSQFYYDGENMIQVGANRYNEAGFAFADNEFFQLFDYDWLAGNPKTALQEPNTVVLTESMALKYFGQEEAMGKIIRLDNRFDLRVSGIIKDVPPNTHLPFSFLVSWETIRKGVDLSHFLNISGGYTYILLPEQLSPGQVQDRLPAFIRKNWGKEMAERARLLLQPLKDIHFDRHYLSDIVTQTSKGTLYGLAGVAVFIILTASINFINLATAQAVRRSKEVGIRKTLGAYRLQLARQSLGETALLVGSAVLLALIAVRIFLPFTKSLLNIRIDASQLADPVVIGLIAGIIILLILAAGFYPAMVQSGFQPVRALKQGITTLSAQRLTLRKGLVTGQFIISQALIIGTLIVARQMDFFRNQDLGFDKDAVISFSLPDNVESKRDVIRQKLLESTGIRQVSLASAGPAYNMNYAPFSSPEMGMTEHDVTELKCVDENYMSMFGLKLLAGEGIGASSIRDTSSSVVVNQTLIRRLGIRDPAEAIGKRIMIGNDPVLIKGVVHDFQSESKHKKIRACILAYIPGAFRQVSVKLHPQNMRETLAYIDKIWSDMYPEYLFKYEFLDDRIASLYIQEEKMYNAFRVFSAIAILIGCLGLYGLMSLVAAQRTKEVGIRKVMGASVAGIVVLFSREFVWLMLIAFVIAAPLAWYAMQHWLQGFAYHIQIGPDIFLVSILVTFVISAVTISYQSVKTALTNPLKSLRSE